ncbi:MAG: hypothetical protein HN474_01795 [Nitrospina sp.]|nr:hypothetical protein [Nitrospina sp.]
MDEDKDNLNHQSNSESSAPDIKDLSQDKASLVPESSSPEMDRPYGKALLESEQPIEHDKVDHTNKDSSLETKKPTSKGWLLFLALAIALGMGFYFYTQKNNEYLFIALPQNLKKLFLTAPKIKNSFDNDFEITPLKNEPKEMTAKSTEEIVKVVEGISSPKNEPKEMTAKPPEEIRKKNQGPNPFEKTMNENEKTIKLLRNEIQSLKSELKETSSTTQVFRTKKLDVSDGFTEKNPKKEEGEPKPKAKNLPTIFQSAQINMPIQKNDPQKIYPERSKEVQAYLNFVEDSGRKLFKLIKTGLANLQAFTGKLKKQYLKEN